MFNLIISCNTPALSDVYCLAESAAAEEERVEGGKEDGTPAQRPDTAAQDCRMGEASNNKPWWSQVSAGAFLHAHHAASGI